MKPIYYVPEKYQRPDESFGSIPDTEDRKLMSTLDYIGAKPIIMIYQGSFMDESNVVIFDKFKQAVNDQVPIDYRGPVCIDLEEPYSPKLVSTNREEREATIAVYVKLLKIAKQMRAFCQWGFYGLPWASTSEGVTYEWRKKIAQYAAVLKESSMLCPSLYMDLPAESQHGSAFLNQRYARQIVKESLRHCQTVFPFYTPRFRASNEPWDLVTIGSLEFISHVAAADAAGAHGGIYWGDDGYNFMRIGSYPVFEEGNPNYEHQRRCKAVMLREIPFLNKFGSRSISSIYCQMFASKMSEMHLAFNGRYLPVGHGHGGRFFVTPEPEKVEPEVDETKIEPPIKMEVIENDTLKIEYPGGARYQPITGPSDVRIDILQAIIEDWKSGINPKGTCGIDDLLLLINLWNAPIHQSGGASMDPVVDLHDEDLNNAIVYCADNKIRKGIRIKGQCELENVLIVGAFMAIDMRTQTGLDIGGKVTAIRCQTFNADDPTDSPIGQQGDQGGYGLWAEGKQITFKPGATLKMSLRNDTSKHRAGQYSCRTDDTQWIMDPTSSAYFYGADGKDYTSRMTGSEGNVLHNCHFFGDTVSFGGTAGGNPSEHRQFSGDIYKPHFHLMPGSKVKVQPGVDGLRFHDVIASSDNWLETDSQAQNVTHTMATQVVS